jgi:hypothetical protein
VRLTKSRVRLDRGKRPTHPWVGGVLLSVMMIPRVRLGQGKSPTHTGIGRVLLSVTDDIQGLVRFQQTPKSSMGWWSSV